MLRPARGMLRSQWDTSLRSAVHQAQALDVAAQVSCSHSVTVPTHIPWPARAWEGLQHH